MRQVEHDGRRTQSVESLQRVRAQCRKWPERAGHRVIQVDDVDVLNVFFSFGERLYHWRTVQGHDVA